MFKTLILAATAAAAITTSASAVAGSDDPVATFLTGNKLLEACNAPKGSWQWSVCLGYLQGAMDQITMSESVFHADGASGPQRICVPVGITGNQLILLVRKSLEADAKDLHLPASVLVWHAAATAYPCPKPAS
jgi:hypothetical protein